MVNCPYYEEDQFSPRALLVIFIDDPYLHDLYTSAYVFQTLSYLQFYPPKTCTHLQTYEW